MKVPIIETWETLFDDERIAYIPELKQNALITPQYEDWVRDSCTKELQEEQSDEIKRLMAIIEAKDWENLQLKKSVETNKELAEKSRRSCEEMQEKHQELKRKCGELYDQTEHMSNPYSRESKYIVIDRLKRTNKFVETTFEK